MAEFYPTTYDANRSLAGGLKRGQITQDDADLIRQFTNERVARAGISAARAKKITSVLVSLRRYILVPYRDVKMSDIDAALTTLKNTNHTVPNTVSKPKPYSQNTKSDVITILKSFLLWMIAKKLIKISIDDVNEIRAPAVNTETTRPEDLLTRDEILALIEVAKQPRDKALIGLLYESGCRIGELARLQWRDIAFEEEWVELRVRDIKTHENKEPKVRHACLVMAKEYLARWKDATTYKGPNDLVFVSLQDGSALSYIALRRIIDRLGKAAGINKRLNPHIFRKSRITHLVNENYQESIVKRSMWNNLNTRMFNTYVRLGKDDIDEEMLAKAGVKQKKVVTKNPLAPRPCGRCQKMNPPTARFCNKCGYQLTGEVIDSMDDARRRAEESPAFKAAYELLLQKTIEEQGKR